MIQPLIWLVIWTYRIKPASLEKALMFVDSQINGKLIMPLAYNPTRYIKLVVKRTFPICSIQIPAISGPSAYRVKQQIFIHLLI